jgi:hypothetical protein
MNAATVHQEVERMRGKKPADAVIIERHTGKKFRYEGNKLVPHDPYEENRKMLQRTLK